MTARKSIDPYWLAERPLSDLPSPRSRHYGSRYCTFNGPAARHPASNDLRRHASLSRNIRYGHALASNLIEPGVATVVGLFLVCCPPTIAGLVVAIHVNALNGVPRRRVAHVSIEVLKCAPSFADCNATSAIFFVLRGIWIAASAEHAAPLDVHPAVLFAMRQPRLDLVSALDSEAPARLSVPALDGLCLGFVTVAA